MVVKTNKTKNDFNATQAHLHDLNRWLVDLLGDDYAINLSKPAEFTHEGKPFIRFETRCIYYSHNEDRYDHNPSGWIAVSLTDGKLISGCWVCGRRQVVESNEGYQPAPTLLTLSRRDKHLLKTLLDFDCEEVKEVNKEKRPAVAFPVTYADGSQGCHYRVVLQGGNKWRHMEGRQAGEAVFALHRQEIQAEIQRKRFVIVTESPVDAATLITAGFPAIAVLGKGNADALACDLHKETLLSLLGDAGTVYVWREPDAAEFPQKVANALQRPVKVIYPPVLEEDPKALKDAYRIWVACGKDWKKFAGEISGLLENATEVVAPQPEPLQATVLQSNGRKVEIPESIFKRLGEIKVQEVEWLVDEYIPIGAVTLLAGEGGAGKSTLLCDLTAAILKGDKWLSKFEVAQGGVVLILTEGAIEIRSRLEGYEITDDSPLEIVDLTAWEDYTPLKAAQALPEILQIAKERLQTRFGDIPIRLVGLDCLRGFGFDEKQATRQKGDRLPTVREIYNPLADFAEKEGSAVIVTHHFRKLLPEERRRLYPKRKKGKEVAPEIDINLLRNLIAGTADIVNAARHALVVVSDHEAGVGIIVPVKSNRSQVLGLPIRYDWQADAPTFLSFMAEDETVMEKATAFLRRVLANGAMASEEVKALAEKEGISKRTLWRAKSRLGVKSAKRVNGDEVIWIWFLPDRPDPQGSLTNPNGNGSVPNPEDNPKLGTLGTLAQKAQQNLAFSSVPNERGFGTVGTLGTDPADDQVCQVCQTQNPLAQTLAHLKSPINTGVSDQVCQVCQTFGNVEGDPLGSPDRPTDPQGSPPAGDPLDSPPDPSAAWFDEGFIPDLIVTEPAGNPLAALPEPVGSPQEAQPANEPDRPEPAGSPLEAPLDLFGDFFDTGILPDLIIEGDQPCTQAQSEVSPPDQSESPTLEPEDSPLEAQPDLPANEPTDSPTAQPVATLNEPVCPNCGEILEPDPESGLAACIACGRLFKVEIPPASPDDDNPPEPDSPDDGGDNDTPPDSPDGGDNPPNPPQTPNNGHSRSKNGFTPPVESPVKLTRIYTNKFSSPAILNRMTERLPDGSLKLVWQDKTETVAPDDLEGWQPIETIPDINLPDIESIEIPPVVVLDIETTDLDPAKGRILAAGLALFVEGKKEETQIIRNKGDEAALLEQVFDWLRETCYDLGEIILTGYNIYGFDLPYLIERARRLEVNCPFRFKIGKNGEIERRQVAATEGTLKDEKIDYPSILVDRSLPIRIVDTQHLVCRWDYTAKQLIHYDLKSVAEHFGVNQPARPILSPDQIKYAFQHDPATFEAYLLSDLQETYDLFAKLIPPYAGIAALTGLPLDLVVVESTAWIWEQILERHYDEIPQPDEKRKYKGGLVVSRKGLWSPCLKIDIASLYPTIMLAYRIHSRKDPAQIALRWLKTLRQQRLALKEKAKAGDANAQTLQEAMKILLNSLYGFYGAKDYGFNDMNAAEKVTEIGRKVLTRMVAAIEDACGIVVEADTDGLIVCYRNAEPETILQTVTAAIPPVFKVEVEWQEATVFVSDDKNYVVIDRNGKIETVKGGKWRGRDKPAYARKAIPTFLQLWATEGVEAALDYAKQVLDEIRSGNGWHWVVQTHRVKEDDKNFIRAGFAVGERAVFAYKVRRKKQKDSEIAKSPVEGYDCNYYAAKFCETVKEVIEAIDPAQIAAWREIVGQEARLLIFSVG